MDYINYSVNDEPIKKVEKVELTTYLAYMPSEARASLRKICFPFYFRLLFDVNLVEIRKSVYSIIALVSNCNSDVT